MSRPKRELKKKFVVFCEGDTEFHYIDQMRKNQGVEISLQPINMKGGGYQNFLDVICTQLPLACMKKPLQRITETFLHIDNNLLYSCLNPCLIFLLKSFQKHAMQ